MAIPYVFIFAIDHDGNKHNNDQYGFAESVDNMCIKIIYEFTIYIKILYHDFLDKGFLDGDNYENFIQYYDIYADSHSNILSVSYVENNQWKQLSDLTPFFNKALDQLMQK
jgi:hypothetical protein